MERELGHCLTCARPFTDRRSWRARSVSSEVKYCSDGCRRAKPRASDRALEEQLLSLLSRQAAQSLPLKVIEERLQVSGERARRRLMWAARRLALRGDLTFSQRGRVVDPGRARGPVVVSKA